MKVKVHGKVYEVKYTFRGCDGTKVYVLCGHDVRAEYASDCKAYESIADRFKRIFGGKK